MILLPLILRVKINTWIEKVQRKFIESRFQVSDEDSAGETEEGRNATEARLKSLLEQPIKDTKFPLGTEVKVCLSDITVLS